MTAANALVLCLAYISGLLLTALPWQVGGIPVGAIALLIAGVGTAMTLPRKWRVKTGRIVWLVAGVIGCIAALYFQARLPQPGDQDISQLLRASNPDVEHLFIVQGKVSSQPRLTQSQRIQFWLEANQATPIFGTAQTAVENRLVDGKVYVTVPLLQGTGLYPGQHITVTGSLYQPKPATNPGGFDFQRYLARQGSFVGLRGDRIDFPENEARSPSPQWRLRQRIVRAQIRGLGSPEGPLVSAMVLGRQAVDISPTLRDEFTRVGLAHTLAASGFHVSLLLGIILTLTRRYSNQVQLYIGAATILTYIGLTGVQPSVLRAGIMGIGALTALALQRKARPVMALVLTATVLLLWNPLWIWDLGFQFSFLATLGLLITAPTFLQWLNQIPPAIASLVAVALAAYLWTLPLQLYTFGTASPYSVVVNIVVSPLVSIISIGGMISAFAAAVMPAAGSGLAALLYYPAEGLISIVKFCTRLPGNSVSVGHISAFQASFLYGLLALTAWQVKWRRRWLIAGILGASLVAIPVWYHYNTRFQATVLDTSGEPVLVVQERGKVLIINSGNETDTSFTVLPFLKQQGINHVNWAVTTQPQDNAALNWHRLLSNVSIDTLYSHTAPSLPHEIVPPAPHQAFSQSPISSGTGSAHIQSSTASLLHDPLLSQHNSTLATLPLSSNPPLSMREVNLNLIQADPPFLKLQIGDYGWAVLENMQVADQHQVVAQHSLSGAQVLWWSGGELLPELLAALNPQVAIASSRSIFPETLQWLNDHQVAIYITGQDGAIQWTPQEGFNPALNVDANPLAAM